MDSARTAASHHVTLESDQDPARPHVAPDQRAEYDAMRERCPIAHDRGHWTVLRHADVVRVIQDHETFSNVVSRHRSVPNGMDPPEHTAYRHAIARYFTAERVHAFEPQCRHIASALVDAAIRPPTSAGCVGATPEIEVMRTLALPFAAQTQCAYFGWPVDLADRLVGWVRRNHEATLARDRSVAAGIAAEFEQLVAGLLDEREVAGASPPRDLTEVLLRERVAGRPLTRTEIASVLRNCTMGEVGTIAAAVGIIAAFLADNPQVQGLLRGHPTDLPAACDEILRLHGPLVDNRRVAAADVTIADQQITRGDRVVVNWVSANRDPRAFPAADMFCLNRDPSDNLLYGAGIHSCPGAMLARAELGAMIGTLLAATASIAPVPNRRAEHAVYPAGGFSAVWVGLEAESISLRR
jgi:cytochrome P450